MLQRIVVVHYHLFPGGVTSSIREGIEALAGSGRLERVEVRVLCGHERGVREFGSRLEGRGARVAVEVHPGLFYRSESWSRADSFEREVRELAGWLLERCPGTTLCWAHNPTLGKNPAVTAALNRCVKIAERESLPVRFLYHIHDFPECGRVRNLAFLSACRPGGGVDPLYPYGSHVGFACINRWDVEGLIAAGADPKRVFFFPNSLPPVDASGEEGSRRGVAAPLKRYAERNGYRFEEGWDWWVMPVRMIRRKNVLEGAFLAAAAGGVQLLVTLDANSDAEFPYAEAVKAVVRKARLPVVAAFGHELVGSAFSLDDLVRASRAVVTTSLLEGFGFAFLEGPRRRRPVVGRGLPNVTPDFGEAGLPVSHLYRCFRVPVPAGTRRRLRQEADAFARRYGALAGIPETGVARYLEEVAARYAEEAVDFGDLDLASQEELVPRLRDPGFVQSLRELNPGAGRVEGVPPDVNERLDRVFGPEPYAERFGRMVEALFVERDPDEGTGRIREERLRERFFSPDWNRPLFRD